MEKKMSIEEFKEEVVNYLATHERKGTDENFLRQCVNDEYYESCIIDGYRQGLESELGMVSGIRYCANNIDLCM